MANAVGGNLPARLVRALQDMRVDHMGGGDLSVLEHEFVHVHDDIANAIIEGRADDAAHLMRQHIEAFIQYEQDNDPGFLEQIVSWR